MAFRMRWVGSVLALVLVLGTAGCAPAIHGRILAVPDGRPVAEAQVVVASTDGEFQPGSVASGRGGRYRIQDLPSGSYSLMVVKPGFVSTEISPVVMPERGGLKLPIELPRKAVVRGRTLTEEGMPLAGTEVFSAAGQSALADDEGAFRLEGLDPGPNTLYALAGEMASDPVTVELAPGPNELDIQLRPADAKLQAYQPGVRKDDDGALTRPLLGDGSQ